MTRPHARLSPLFPWKTSSSSLSSSHPTRPRTAPILGTALGLTLLALLIASPPSRAGYATEVTQVLNNIQLVLEYVQLLKSYERQGDELANAIRNYNEAVRNGKALPGQVFGPIESDLAALATLSRQGRALAYSLGNLDAEFRRRFTGHGYRGTRYGVEYADWAQTSLDTTLSALRAVGLQEEQLRSEESVLAALRQMARSADGRMQAIAVTNQIAEAQVQQLQKLRQLLMADLSAKAAWQAAETQREMAQSAAARKFFDYAPAKGDATPFWGGSR